MFRLCVFCTDHRLAASVADRDGARGLTIFHQEFAEAREACWVIQSLIFDDEQCILKTGLLCYHDYTKSCPEVLTQVYYNIDDILEKI
jgi:hypothetical protein